MCLRTGIFTLFFSAGISELFCAAVLFWFVFFFLFSVRSIVFLDICDTCFTFQNAALSFGVLGVFFDFVFVYV